jgi:uncharacterized protein YndB with AHSA1/START domain/DNA-binding transcriptional ArsR family regulator
MLDQMNALSDAARWRIVLLLAERPRSVGIVADLTGLRQPQASKHLQTLERTGIAASRRSGQRRIYALEPEALRSLGEEVARVAELARHSRAMFDQHAAAVDAETLAADRTRWADGREYVFRRTLASTPSTVWSHLTEPELVSEWWAPTDLRLAQLEWGTQPGQRVRQVYTDTDDRAGGDGVIGEAVGAIEAVEPGRSLSFVLSPQLLDGSQGFSGHYEWLIEAGNSGTEFEVRLRIDDTTVPSAEFVAGIELGWNQSLDRLALILQNASEDGN